MKKVVSLLAAMTFFSGIISAQTNDFGTWTSVQVVKSFDKNFAMARLEHRSFDKVGSTECYFGMAGFGRRLNNWLSGDLSYEFWKVPAAGNITTHKAVASLTGTLKRDALAVSVREKYELAFTDGANSSTLRSRIRAQYKCADAPFTPYIMFEFFSGFGGTGWIRSLHYIGSEIRLGGGSALDIFYMYHMFPKGANLEGCHLLGIGYVLNL